MAKLIRREVRRRGFFGWLFLIVFFAFNGLMLWWLVEYWALIHDKLTTGGEAMRGGAATGSAIGTGAILMVWALGAVITGLLRTYIEETVE